MPNLSRSGGALLAMAALGCTEPAGPAQRTGEAPVLEAAGAGVEQSVTGGGQFFHPTLGTVTVSVAAIRHADGRVTGRFQQQQFDLGFTYKGDVTCFAVDPVNHRAWIGGVLTESNDQDPVALVGKDAWFRVLDVGNGSAEPDRSTFLGFEGSAGITTSEEYCAVKLWAPDNARTWPIEHGNVVLR